MNLPEPSGCSSSRGLRIIFWGLGSVCVGLLVVLWEREGVEKRRNSNSCSCSCSWCGVCSFSCAGLGGGRVDIGP